MGSVYDVKFVWVFFHIVNIVKNKPKCIKFCIIYSLHENNLQFSAG